MSYKTLKNVQLLYTRLRLDFEQLYFEGRDKTIVISALIAL
jgi:hypothetical protein